MGNALEGSAGNVDVLVIGGGPTGIGAAYRLNQHNCKSWILLDAERQPGGLAGSIKTHEGFRFDHGYKTFCNRYEYIDRMLEICYNGSQFTKLKRRSRDCYVNVKGRLIRFPLQNNLSGLPEADQLTCTVDLVRARITEKSSNIKSEATKEAGHPQTSDDQIKTVQDVAEIQEQNVVIMECVEEKSQELVEDSSSPETLDEYLIRRWGESICNILFRPYIFKAFAYPTSKLSADWAEYKILPSQIGQDIERIIANEQCDPGLDSEASFLYPSKGGLVTMWRSVIKKLPKDNVRFKSEIVDLDFAEKTVRTKDGLEIRYETLISTMPLTSLLELAGRNDLNESLVYSSLYIVCLGIRGTSSHENITGCIYFPESDCIFHRATVFSSFDPDSVPNKDESIATMRLAKETPESKSSGSSVGPYWSLMIEVSAGPLRTVSDATIMDEVIRDAVSVGLLRPNDEIVSIHMTEMTHGHPLPTPDSKDKVDEALEWLKSQGIYSRGRFGGFKYHVGDLDHCFIQGVEAADNIINGTPERCLWSRPIDMNYRREAKLQYPVHDIYQPEAAGREDFTAGEVRNAITREPSISTSSFVSTSTPLSRTSSQLDGSDSEGSFSTK